MSYKFKLNETYASGFHRIASRQIERVAQCLDAADDVHEGVHEARKTLKRLRALVSLYRGMIDEQVYRDLDRRFRDIARALAGTREIQAMLDSIDQLEPIRPNSKPRPVLMALRMDLAARREVLTARSAQPGTAVALLRRDLDAAACLLGQVDISRDDFGAIRGGLERTYRGARRWQARAYAGKPDMVETSETFHEWRKRLQRHWRHMQLLTQAWPQYMRARAQLTHTIAETVGQEHDLGLLDLRLAASGRTLGTTAQLRECRVLCQQHQLKLRAEIRADGEQLFLEGAKAFSRRMEGYWSAACKRDERTEGEQRSVEPA